MLKDRIVNVDSNTFRIKKEEFTPFIYFYCFLLNCSCLIGIGALISNSCNIYLKIAGCLGLVLLGVFIVICFIRIDIDKYIKLESNSLSIISKRLCCKPRITVYRYEELKHAAIFYITKYDEGVYHFYRLVLVHNSSEKIKIFYMSSRIKEQDLKYFYYLVDVINEHIKNNIQI